MARSTRAGTSPTSENGYSGRPVHARPCLGLKAISRYDEAWAEVDDGRRLALLKAIWADDGVYFDPDIPQGVRGPQALSDFIAVTQSELPGFTITTTRQVCVLGAVRIGRDVSSSTSGRLAS
jgi:hypothetical protein